MTNKHLFLFIAICIVASCKPEDENCEPPKEEEVPVFRISKVNTMESWDSFEEGDTSSVSYFYHENRNSKQYWKIDDEFSDPYYFVDTLIYSVNGQLSEYTSCEAETDANCYSIEFEYEGDLLSKLNYQYVCDICIDLSSEISYNPQGKVSLIDRGGNESDYSIYYDNNQNIYKVEVLYGGGDNSVFVTYQFLYDDKINPLWDATNAQLGMVYDPMQLPIYGSKNNVHKILTRYEGEDTDAITYYFYSYNEYNLPVVKYLMAEDYYWKQEYEYEMVDTN